MPANDRLSLLSRLFDGFTENAHSGVSSTPAILGTLQCMIVRSPMRSFVGFITILTNGTDQQKKDGLFFPSNRSQCMTIMHKSSEYRAALPEHLQHGYSNIHHYWVECAEATLRDTLILWRPLCENKLEMASITRGLHLSFVRRLFAARASCLDFPYSTLPDTRLSVTDDHTLVEYAQRKP